MSQWQRGWLLLKAASGRALAGCAKMSDSQRTTATGVGGGTAAGAVIGAIAGDGKGAATQRTPLEGPNRAEELLAPTSRIALLSRVKTAHERADWDPFRMQADYVNVCCIRL